jgi:hypothetical protein
MCLFWMDSEAFSVAPLLYARIHSSFIKSYNGCVSSFMLCHFDLLENLGIQSSTVKMECINKKRFNGHAVCIISTPYSKTHKQDQTSVVVRRVRYTLHCRRPISRKGHDVMLYALCSCFPFSQNRYPRKHSTSVGDTDSFHVSWLPRRVLQVPY